MNIELICINQEISKCGDCIIDVDCQFYRNKYNVKYTSYKETQSGRKSGLQDEEMGMWYCFELDLGCRKSNDVSLVEDIQ